MTDTPDLTWLVKRRTRCEALLLRLYATAKVPKPRANAHSDALSVVLQLLLGTTFSLWRAVFLLDRPRTRRKIHDDALAFLVYAIRDNIINYPQDRATGAWSGGYYLNNAVFRLRELEQEKLARAGLPTPPGLDQMGGFLAMEFEKRLKAKERKLWDMAYKVALSICESLESQRRAVRH